MVFRMQVKAAHPISQCRSNLSKQHQNDYDDQDGTERTDAAVTEAIAISAEAAAEASEQEYDEDDNENCTERHDFISLVRVVPRKLTGSISRLR